MHASIDQLIDIRDGIENAAAEHVEGCEQCQAELAYLDKMSQQMLDAVEQTPSPDAWDRILAASNLKADAAHNQSASNVHYIDGAKNHNPLSRAIYTLAASITFVGLISVFMISQQNSAQQQATSQMQASIDQLMVNSRGLENVLQQVGVKKDRLNEDDRATAERLYWRLTHVDQELHASNPETPEEAERIKILWSDRVEVLNELNRLFYQQRKDALINAEY